MQYGIYCGPELTDTALKAGFDFFEWNVGLFLKPRESNSAFADALAAVRKAALKCPVVNCFIPNDLKITGPEVDVPALEKFVKIACERAREAGVKTIVFGSGSARNVPNGFDRARARRQIVDFCRMLAPVAEARNVTIAVEPLHLKASNILNTVDECADLVREVNRPAIRLLVDSFHFLLDNDSLKDISANGHLLAHVHVATVPKRLPPGAEPCDLFPFFKALVSGGYDGRVSLECELPEGDACLRDAVACMKALEEKAKKSARSLK
jgi:sugar phosphate isomerase/epimerase